MKKTVWCFLMTTLMMMLLACGTKNGGDDSKDMAEDQNDEKFQGDAEDDADFAVEAASGGMMEVQLGTLALTKATSPDVKSFAQMMVDDHTKANNELKSLAQQKNITLPTTLDDEHQRKFDNLNEKTGEDFDKDYIDLMVKDHKEDVRKFEDEGKDGKDADLKSWASGKVATLRHHLEEAQRIQDVVKDRDSAKK
jgi:putative membrane protein